MRQSVEYVLVYNENTNDHVISTARKKSKEENEKIILSTELMKLGGEELILSDLEKFQNYCFKAVHTYTIAQFEEYLNKGT